MKQGQLIALILGAVAIGAGVFVMRPRGIRNNNPGNIEYNPANNWNGQTGTDGRYAIFDEIENGIRAAGKLIRNYQTRHGLRTIRQIIERWAPHTENPTDAYIANVAKAVGLPPDYPVAVGSDDVLAKFLDAVFYQENGLRIPDAQIREGIARI